MTTGRLPSTTATQEFVVPRSMPMTVSTSRSSYHAAGSRFQLPTRGPGGRPSSVAARLPLLLGALGVGGGTGGGGRGRRRRDGRWGGGGRGRARGGGRWRGGSAGGGGLRGGGRREGRRGRGLHGGHPGRGELVVRRQREVRLELDERD